MTSRRPLGLRVQVQGKKSNTVVVAAAVVVAAVVVVVFPLVGVVCFVVGCCLNISINRITADVCPFAKTPRCLWWEPSSLLLSAAAMTEATPDCL